MSKPLSADDALRAIADLPHEEGRAVLDAYAYDAAAGTRAHVRILQGQVAELKTLVSRLNNEAEKAAAEIVRTRGERDAERGTVRQLNEALAEAQAAVADFLKVTR